jgi:hypothetical protein
MLMETARDRKTESDSENYTNGQFLHFCYIDKYSSVGK